MAGPSVKLLQGSLGRRLRQSFDFSYFQRGYQQQLGSSQAHFRIWDLFDTCNLVPDYSPETMADWSGLAV